MVPPIIAVSQSECQYCLNLLSPLEPKSSHYSFSPQMRVWNHICSLDSIHESMCHHTSQNPTLCRLPFTTHRDAIVASVIVHYVMSGGQCNSQHNWLWHVKWQISPGNLKRQFFKREGRCWAWMWNENCLQIERWRKGFFIPDLAVGQVSRPHDLHLQPSLYSLSTQYLDQLLLSNPIRSVFPRRDLYSRMFPLNSLLSHSKPNFYSFSISSGIYEADQILRCYSSQGYIPL